MKIEKYIHIYAKLLNIQKVPFLCAKKIVLVQNNVNYSRCIKRAKGCGAEERGRGAVMHAKLKRKGGLVYNFFLK